ncbi:UPF0147 family protein [Candidatus Woesearchaeota archaeon]|nr:UPF0147 family protein [Candidatus Woesearchaeota archaeon]
MVNKEIEGVITTLSEIKEDATVPKNVKAKMQEIIGTLEEDTILSIKVNKALNNMEEIAADVNLQPYTRTQIWNVISILEKLQ